ncbi:MAG: mechanosensitive ion channel [Cyclobacteriaceae bacterium]|nr:mechanosensitive ion channel [Cyclobacteriaceae bacterium]MDH4296724.1 mechanosensitive ion channel [Cyclobacteriaceae bacterium]MDH5249947.1 mechanosensitive ion channel [Cyclobacteriaceae bacterium]
MSSKNTLCLIFSIAFIACSLSGFSQPDKQNGGTDSTSVIKFADVQGEYKRLVTQIPLMLERYKDSTLLNSSSAELDRNSEALSNIKLRADEILSGYMSSAQTTNLQGRLNRSRVRLESLSMEITDITTEIENSLSVLERTKSNWSGVLQKAATDTIFMTLLPQVQEALALTVSAEKKLQYQLSGFLAIQSRINQNQNDISEYSERVENAKSLSFVRLFQRDSISIWSSQKDGSLKQGANVKFFSGSVTQSVTESFEYINENASAFIWLLILGLSIYFAMFVLQRLQKASEDDSDLFSAEGLTIRYPIASAIITILLIAILSLKNRPTLLTEVLLVAFAFPVIIFSLDKAVRNPWIYWVIIIAYMISVILNLISLPIKAHLILLVALNLAASSLLYWMYRNHDRYLTHLRGIVTQHIKTLLVPAYLYLSIITLLLIIIGYRSLAKLMLSGIVGSLYVGPVILLCAHIIISFLQTFSRTAILTNSHIVNRYLQLSFKLIRLGAWLLWIKGLLSAFEVEQFFVDTATEFWALGGNFGEIHVTIGGVLSTIIIILLSFVISNFIKVLLEEEVFSRLDVPRGVPMAMGVLGKYFVIVLGFFLAVASTGFDLTKMSILAGALGVGVGFGLQNLVSNFVSGMILIFERPILVGDIIEAEGKEGTVSEIGIRSSKMITYAGAEVIIPNASLISNSISNWTLTNRRRRFFIEVRTHGNANPAEVVEVLQHLAASHAKVIKDPAPFVVFEGQQEQTLLFKLYYWQDGEILITRGELNVQIYNALRALGVELSIPMIEIRK